MYLGKALNPPRAWFPWLVLGLVLVAAILCGEWS